MKKALILLVLSIILPCCNGQSVSTKSKAQYVKNKISFDEYLVSHFPLTVTDYPYNLVNSKNLTKNDVGLVLYEYDRGAKKIDSITENIKHKSIAKYNSEEECLLIVNRFETIETLENMEDVVIDDSSRVNNDCYDTLYPIPNFIDYKLPEIKNEIKLDKSFDIYVLEAKSGNHFKEFELLPNLQMPKKWENGYSRGIAISKEKKNLIYWGIVW